VVRWIEKRQRGELRESGEEKKVWLLAAGFRFEMWAAGVGENKQVRVKC